ncbi:hypothetical protein J6590_073919 [Homalodisca vitripennis]|nr:hypothetical protein J6590_073919 [Homalodisca vitripennis]
MEYLPKEMHWLCQTFGGLPLKSTPETKSIKQLTFSLAGFLWCLTLVLIQEVLSSFILYFTIAEGKFDLNKNKTIKFTVTLDVLSLQIVAAVTFLSCTCKYPMFVGVFNTLERVNCDLQCKREEVRVRGKSILLLTVTTLLFIISFAYIAMNDVKVFLLISYVSMLLLDWTQLTVILNFTDVAQNIAMGFRMVSVKMKEEIACNIIERMGMNRGQSNVEIAHGTRTTLSKIEKLKTLMNTYWMLCDAVHQANDFYCDQLMAVMFSLFVHVTIKAYFFFLFLRAGEVFAMISEAAWVLVYICYAVILVNSGTDVTNSVNTTFIK